LTDKVRGAVVGSRSERNYRSISDRDECKYDEMPPPPEYDEEEYEIIRESGMYLCYGLLLFSLLMRYA
jgi:hypothetical protein